MGKGVCVCAHTPDRDYVPEDSYHTCLPLRPDLCLSGQRCIYRDSCPSHSVFLAINNKTLKIRNTKLTFLGFFIGKM